MGLTKFCVSTQELRQQTYSSIDPSFFLKERIKVKRFSYRYVSIPNLIDSARNILTYLRLLVEW